MSTQVTMMCTPGDHDEYQVTIDKLRAKHDTTIGQDMPYIQPWTPHIQGLKAPHVHM